MSLKDTIQGAREEAAGNRVFDRDKTSTDEGADGASVEKTRKKQRRASAATSKPSRQKAAGVRMVTSDGRTKSRANMSKEERKAEKKRDREKEDQRYTLTQAVLKDNAEYQRLHKIWFRFLIAGVALMVIALALYGMVSQRGAEAPMALSVASIVVMVVAYAVVIVGMVFDWRKVKPLRDEADRRTASMSEKRVRTELSKRAAEQQK